jgi:GDPmannose 4,6-dehydratase
VTVAYQRPVGTIHTNSVIPAMLLQAIRESSFPTRFVQASSAAMFGQPQEAPQNEGTPLRPTTPYGTSKTAAHWLTVNYREAFGLHASSAILFNHESPLRGREFITQRIVARVANYAEGKRDGAIKANLEGARDWFHAADAVEALLQMSQAEVGDDYVVASGRLRTLREFIEVAFAAVDVRIAWEEDGGYDRANGRRVVEADLDLNRPTEAAALVGDPTKIRERLGWRSAIPFEEMVGEMVRAVRTRRD